MIATTFANVIMCFLLTTCLTANLRRMHILTADSADETCQKTAIAFRTCMYTETYDTQRIPYHENCCKYTCSYILHFRMQR